jgi:hypothetical protein
MKPNPALIFALAFAVAPAVLAAQNAAPAGGAGAHRTGTITTFDGKTSKTSVMPLTSGPSCPVSMQAKQGSGSGLVMVHKAQPKDAEPLTPTKPGQHIHLILAKIPSDAFSLQQVASATVTARGLSARDRLDRTVVVPGNSSSSDLVRTLEVAFTRENDGSLFADLDLPGFTAVRSIRIESIALKGGSKWTLDDSQHCVVAPDPMMLIASQ